MNKTVQKKAKLEQILARMKIPAINKLFVLIDRSRSIRSNFLSNVPGCQKNEMFCFYFIS